MALALSVLSMRMVFKECELESWYGEVGGSLSPLSLDAGAALAQPRGVGVYSRGGLEVSSCPGVLLVSASSRNP